MFLVEVLRPPSLDLKAWSHPASRRRPSVQVDPSTSWFRSPARRVYTLRHRRRICSIICSVILNSPKADFDRTLCYECYPVSVNPNVSLLETLKLWRMTYSNKLVDKHFALAFFCIRIWSTCAGFHQLPSPHNLSVGTNLCSCLRYLSLPAVGSQFDESTSYVASNTDRFLQSTWFTSTVYEHSLSCSWQV